MSPVSFSNLEMQKHKQTEKTVIASPAVMVFFLSISTKGEII